MKKLFISLLFLGIARFGFAASNHDLMSIARDLNFEDRIRFSATAIARNVLAEDGSTFGHASRIAFAEKILVQNYDLLVLSMAVLSDIDTNPSTTEFIGSTANVTSTTNAGFGILDLALPTSIFRMFNAFSGVTN